MKLFRKIIRFISNKYFFKKNFKFFLKYFIFDEIVLFNEGINYKKSNSTIKRVFALHETDDRFKWLKYANTDNHLEIYYIPRSIFSSVWKKLLSHYSINSSDGEINLEKYNNNKFFNNRRIFRKYCYKCMKFIKEKFAVDLFLLPKMNDDWITDLIPETIKIGIPVVIDDREVISTPKRLEVYPPILKKYLNFKVDLLTVGSEMHKDFFVRSGYDSNAIKINGTLVSDFWSRNDLWKMRREIHPLLNPKKIQILYFSFGLKSYINFYFYNEKRDWRYINDDYHSVILDILKKYGDKVQIIYKTGGKPQRDYYPGYDNFYNELKRTCPNDCFIPLNVRYNTFDLINTSDIIIGFYTSGLIESMFTDKPILFGGWGDLFNDIKDDLIPFHKTQALTFINSKEDLLSEINKLINNKKFSVTKFEMDERKKFREKYFFNPDGNVAKRLLNEINNLI